MRSGEYEMSPGEIRGLLDELVRRLIERGVTGSIRIGGGAAMALRYPDDPSVRATRDVDAVYEPRPEVEAVIAELTRERGLEKGWLNSNAAGWLRVSGGGSGSSFAVEVATPQELIAMKLAAGREHDLVDIATIARHLGITDPAEVVDIAYEVFGEDAVELPDGRQSYLYLAEAALGYNSKR